MSLGGERMKLFDRFRKKPLVEQSHTRLKEKPITREDAIKALQNREPVDQSVKFMGKGESKLDRHLRTVDRIIAQLEYENRRCRLFK
jgi:hypothetical protein